MHLASAQIFRLLSCVQIYCVSHIFLQQQLHNGSLIVITYRSKLWDSKLYSSGFSKFPSFPSGRWSAVVAFSPTTKWRETKRIISTAALSLSEQVTSRQRYFTSTWVDLVHLRLRLRQRNWSLSYTLAFYWWTSSAAVWRWLWRRNSSSWSLTSMRGSSHIFHFHFLYHSKDITNRKLSYRWLETARNADVRAHSLSIIWAALQIQDRSPKSRPVASLNQSQMQPTRPVLDCNATITYVQCTT